MSWGSSGMLKSRSGMDAISNRSESIRFLIGGYIPSWDIQFQSFDHVTSSYLKWLACSQILAFQAVLIDTRVLELFAET